MRATTQLRQLLQQPEILLCPGVFDGLSARLAMQAEFKAVYASGGAIARSSGYPDLGLLSFSEICERLRQIADVVNIPIIADADNGYGNALNVYRTVRLFERTGIAALHLEDQECPKRCGHLNNKKIISSSEMVGKIKAARDALNDVDFVLIARTDAIAIDGFSAAIERAHAYLAAGADIIFVEAPETVEQIENIGKQISHPKLINMFIGGKTPLVPVAQLQTWGYRIVIIPSDLQRAAMYAMQATLMAIKQDGDSHRLNQQMVSFNEREKIIGTAEYLQRDKQYSA